MRTLLLLLLVGCVPKGRYEVSQIQLKATRAALQAREADAREKIDTAEGEIDELRTRVAELESLASIQLGHLEEMEAELDTLAAELAEHALYDQETCPPLPTCDEEGCAVPPEEPPTEEQITRREHVDASVRHVADALARRARERLEASERRHQHEEALAAFQELVDDELVFVDRHPRGTLVRVLVAKLYNENTTTLSPLGIKTLGRMHDALGELRDHRVEVVGHTDDIPSSSVSLPSNWELGFAYAAGVVRTLEDLRTPVGLSATSRAGREPLVRPVDAASRRLNRRVELILIPRVVEVPEPEPQEPHPPHPVAPPEATGE